jgi:hypothetical protein
MLCTAQSKAANHSGCGNADISSRKPDGMLNVQ